MISTTRTVFLCIAFGIISQLELNSPLTDAQFKMLRNMKHNPFSNSHRLLREILELDIPKTYQVAATQNKHRNYRGTSANNHYLSQQDLSYVDCENSHHKICCEKIKSSNFSDTAALSSACSDLANVEFKDRRQNLDRYTSDGMRMMLEDYKKLYDDLHAIPVRENN